VKLLFTTSEETAGRRKMINRGKMIDMRKHSVCHKDENKKKKKNK
jgi:hypothetical protein